MEIFKLGFRNTGRNRKRTLINALTISAAVIAIILFDVLVEGQLNDLVGNYIRMGIGHIKIHKKGYDKESERLPLDILINNAPETIKKISDINDIRDIYPRLKAGGLISCREKQSPVVINGADLEKEKDIELITEKNIEGNIPKKGEYGILIGKELASLLEVKPGDIVFLYSRTRYETHNVIDLEVSGIYSIGFSTYEKSNIFMPIDILQELIGSSSVSELTIMIEDENLVDAITDSTKSKLAGFNMEVFPYHHYLSEVQNISAMQQSAIIYIRFILLTLAFFGIVNMMMISVWERKKEIGTMRTIGYSKLQITGMFLCEGFWLGVLGSLLGCIIAFFLSLILKNFGIPLPEELLVGINLPMSTHIYGKMLPEFFGRTFFLGVIASILATIPPSFRAVFLPIVKALREY